jgi:hypothetical protein
LSRITEAEAHLYVAVALGDGVIEKEEYLRAPYYAKKSQKFFDMMSMNKSTADEIGPKIREIMNSSKFKGLTSDDHLDIAVSLLKECKDGGVWQSRVTFAKNEKGFTSVAKLGGYVIKEAAVIKKIEERLKDI